MMTDQNHLIHLSSVNTQFLHSISLFLFYLRGRHRGGIAPGHKGHVNPKIHVFFYVKSGVENGYEIRFVQFDLF